MRKNIENRGSTEMLIFFLFTISGALLNENLIKIFGSAYPELRLLSKRTVQCVLKVM